MSIKPGQWEHRKWEQGKRLTRKEAILAQCYVCNGQHVVGPKGDIDCLGKDTCPLYSYFPYRSVKNLIKAV